MNLAQSATCEFLLDYDEEEEDDESSSGKKSKKKKPWRYRWPDDFRDEVLARLLALNAERADQELLTGEATKDTTARTRSKLAPRESTPDKASPQHDLF